MIRRILACVIDWLLPGKMAFDVPFSKVAALVEKLYKSYDYGQITIIGTRHSVRCSSDRFGKNSMTIRHSERIEDIKDFVNDYEVTSRVGSGLLVVDFNMRFPERKTQNTISVQEFLAKLLGQVIPRQSFYHLRVSIPNKSRQSDLLEQIEENG